MRTRQKCIVQARFEKHEVLRVVQHQLVKLRALLRALRYHFGRMNVNAWEGMATVAVTLGF